MLDSNLHDRLIAHGAEMTLALLGQALEEVPTFAVFWLGEPLLDVHGRRTQVVLCRIDPSIESRALVRTQARALNPIGVHLVEHVSGEVCSTIETTRGAKSWKLLSGPDGRLSKVEQVHGYLGVLRSPS